MSELEKIFLTSALTIFGSITVYVIGQIISKFVIEPIHEQKKLIGEIADSLIFYAYVYANPGLAERNLMDEASNKFRQQATLLQSKTHLIPLYSFFSCLGVVVNRSNIEKAASNLIGLSNSVYRVSSIDDIAGRNLDRADEIKTLLRLKIKG